MACMIYFARCMHIIFDSLLAQLVKYNVHTTRKIKFIHAICYYILLLSYFDARLHKKQKKHMRISTSD